MASENRGLSWLEYEVRERAQVRLHIDEALAGVAKRGHRSDIELWVSGKEAKKLATGITASTGHSDRN
ncbi:hypothetical protein GCM10009655_27530 [Rhodoglobus aureus]|uniref:Uncharacterized protein n=1 Tax=Rhodoglobus aureus TaxID=191497 RepID=A0ABN1W1R5_9MICO